MHYRGFAIVPEPTDENVGAVMDPHSESYKMPNHFDYYRAGGRYDG